MEMKRRSIGQLLRGSTRGFRPSAAAWRGATWGLYALWLFMILWALGPTLFPAFNPAGSLGVLALYGYLGLSGLCLLAIVGLLARLPPPYRLPFYLVLPTAVLIAALTWQRGAPLAVAVLIGGLSILCGALTAALAKRTLLSGSTAWLLVAAAVLTVGLTSFFSAPAQLNPALVNFHRQNDTLALPDPGAPGPYAVVHFTYGSGHDKRRPEYGARVRFITHPVDGSRIYGYWTGLKGWLRTRYWGFDAAHMPLQAQVWMPQASGSFPLVLIVHGNHAMEEPSDAGYEYLGTHLASHGFILASVDENFLNSGGADALTDPLQSASWKEIPARAWLLLEHLRLWRAWSTDPGNPLYGKVDLEHIGLIGHSRGGEAVVLANQFNQMGAFADDATIPFDYHFHILALAAIAPTEGTYLPRTSHVELRDQNYFVMGGSRDGDNGTSFLGQSQYSRTTFSAANEDFKASIYIKDANHGQFNTTWGRNDAPTVYRFLTDERQILSGSAQRQIAKVYLTAFLNVTLKSQIAYRALFQDPRNGAAWLPDTFIVNNYAAGPTHWLANYEEDADPTTGSDPNVRIVGSNLEVWKEIDIDLKLAKLGTHVAAVGWNHATHPGDAPRYRLIFSKPQSIAADTNFVFGAAQMLAAERDRTPLDWTITVVDAAGQVGRVPLSSNRPLYPQIRGMTPRAGLIGAAPSEVVMQYFRFPLRDFRAANPALDLGKLVEIRLEFDRSPSGEIVLDDLGLEEMRHDQT
jgi:Chlorophyllase enzyme